MPVIAVTGGIGSGKSTVRRMLEERGALGVDADDLAREVVEPGMEGARHLREAFGDDFFDSEGRLDRKKMAARVFSDHRAREIIEGILHPLIRARESRLVRGLLRSSPEAVVVVEIPLLTEKGLGELYDGVVLVTAPEDVRVERLEASGRYTAQEAAARMAHQAGDEDRRKMATWIIDNGRDLDATARQVDEICRQLAGRE